MRVQLMLSLQSVMCREELFPKACICGHNAKGAKRNISVGIEVLSAESSLGQVTG
jgi:hypothetical protein